MKTKGFTLVELLVACTLLLMLSTVSFTSTYNFVTAAANLKGQSNGIQNIMALHTDLANAKLNYATDLALVIAAGAPTASPAPTQQQIDQANYAQQDITAWNSFAQGDTPKLIDLLINPDQRLPTLPLAPLNPGSRSYLPTSRVLKLEKFSGGTTVKISVTVQITDLTSLLKAYELTDDTTPTGNIVATISVGPLAQSGAMVRPTLPIIDWKSGTPQEILY
jgi:prepilin-type N-terminal cleavage/methylation domain-containing protein